MSILHSLSLGGLRQAPRRYFSALLVAFAGVVGLAIISYTQPLHAQHGDQHARSLQILVLDSITGRPVADVFVQGGESNDVTNTSGIARITRQAKLQLRLSHLSYETKVVSLSPKERDKAVRITLTPANTQLTEVVVYGSSDNRSISVAQHIRREEILSNMGKTLAEALSGSKGVAMLSTGPLASKPSIHGMHSGRVMIVNNGIRHIGQDWGVDHAPEVDYDMAGEIRVIKGAEAVRFGAGALGGVIEMKPPRLRYQTKSLQGEVSTTYASNSRQIQGMGRLSGGLGKHWAWRLQSSLLRSGDRHTAEYYLQNTGEAKWSLTSQLGYKRGRWQSELTYGLYRTKQGTMFQWQIGSEDLFKKRLELGRPILKPGEVERFTYDIDLPYSEVIHHQLGLNTLYRIDEQQRLSLNLGYQQDQREEYHHRRNNLSHIPEYSMTLTSADGELSYRHESLLGLTTELGAVGHLGHNANLKGTGVVPLIPNYAELQAGAYAWQKLSLGRLALEWGGRYEFRFVNADGHDYNGEHYSASNTYNLWGGQLGASYHFTPDLRLITSLGLTQRAPHVFEMHSNGIDKASGVYASGNPDLKPESGYKWVLAIEGKGARLDWSIEGFVQQIRDYIYYAYARETRRMLSGYYPLFLFRQEHARFAGADLKVEWSILPGLPLSYGLQGGYIWAKTTSGIYPPGLPPLRIRQWLAYERAISQTIKLSARVTHSWVAKQNLFSPSTDLVDYTPPSYQLWSASCKLTARLKGSSQLELEVSGSNLANKLYKDYTNRFRYYFHDLGRDLRVRLSYIF